jgi:hypothetical protein
VDNFVDIYPSRAKILGKSRLSTRRLEKKQICIPIKIKYLAITLCDGTAFDGFRRAGNEAKKICEQVQKMRCKHGKSC